MANIRRRLIDAGDMEVKVLGLFRSCHTNKDRGCIRQCLALLHSCPTYQPQPLWKRAWQWVRKMVHSQEVEPRG
jgi:hypothetical protein